MTVDVEGHIYAAVRSADRFGIVVYSPEGAELAYIPTPELPTNCCFGSGDGATMLYITAGTGLYRIPLKIAGYHPAVAAIE
jgi:gluconolactonase